MISDLSRLPDRSILGLCFHPISLPTLLRYRVLATHFSNEVAKLVTHPLWPTRVPRITSCSAMLGKVASHV